MNEKILVVDDEKEIADLLEVYLKNDNYIYQNITMELKHWNVFRKRKLIWRYWTLCFLI